MINKKDFGVGEDHQDIVLIVVIMDQALVWIVWTVECLFQQQDTQNVYLVVLEDHYFQVIQFIGDMEGVIIHITEDLIAIIGGIFGKYLFRNKYFILNFLFK